MEPVFIFDPEHVERVLQMFDTQTVHEQPEVVYLYDSDIL